MILLINDIPVCVTNEEKEKIEKKLIHFHRYGLSRCPGNYWDGCEGSETAAISLT